MSPNSPSRLTELRKRRNLSQQQLADLVGAHLVTVNKLENGKTPLTDPWTHRFAVALSADPREIDPDYKGGPFVKISKSINDKGNITSLGKDLFIELDELFSGPAVCEWVLVLSGRLSPIVTGGDLLCIDRTADIKGEEIVGRLCYIVQGDSSGFGKPFRVEGSKVDFVDTSGYIWTDQTASEIAPVASILFGFAQRLMREA